MYVKATTDPFNPPHVPVAPESLSTIAVGRLPQPPGGVTIEKAEVTAVAEMLDWPTGDSFPSAEVSGSAPELKALSALAEAAAVVTADGNDR